MLTWLCARGSYSCLVTCPLQMLLDCIFQRDLDFLRNLCWEVLILIVKSICICIPEKGCVRLFAAMPVLTLFTLKGKPRLMQVLGYQLVYSNVL